MQRQALSFLVLLLAISTMAMAQAQAYTSFEPISSFDLVVDGDVDEAAQMLQSRSPRAVLVVSSRLPSPVLLLPGEGVAQAVPLLRLVPRDDGRVRLLRGDELRAIGGFELTDDGIRFSYEGVEARLQTREPLVGRGALGT